MILKSPEKHLTDQEFFTHIKLNNLIFKHDTPEAEDDDKDTFRLTHLKMGNDESYKVFNRIFMGSQVLGLTVRINKGYQFDENLKEAKVETEKKASKEKEALLKTLEKIGKGEPIGIEEAADVTWVWTDGLYDHMVFTISEYKIPKEIETMFTMETNKYLDNYINDKLAISTKNYFKFEAQKKSLIKLIEEGQKISLYGNNFIISEKLNSDSTLERAPEFSIVQTVYALQKLGYLKVVNIWGSTKYPKGNNSYSSDPARYIDINLALEDDFIREINDSYKKTNPQNIVEKFDSKKGVLKLAGQDIELSKKGKETDAVLLMTTLLKAKGDEWKHNDEILTDWGYNDDDQKDVAKNKVYYAGQKINNAVALKTKIDDFIECNTSKARINPKYRKVDE
jgi:hypothetical protein